VLELNADRPNDNSLPYFGKDTSDWAKKQTLGNIEQASVPVMILVAELDRTGFAAEQRNS